MIRRCRNREYTGITKWCSRRRRGRIYGEETEIFFASTRSVAHYLTWRQNATFRVPVNLSGTFWTSRLWESISADTATLNRDGPEHSCSLFCFSSDSISLRLKYVQFLQYVRRLHRSRYFESDRQAFVYSLDSRGCCKHSLHHCLWKNHQLHFHGSKNQG